jgi:hypothetical protein
MWFPYPEFTPPVNEEDESDYLLVLTRGYLAPITAFYANGKFSPITTVKGELDVRAWMKMPTIPAVFYDGPLLDWAIKSNLVVMEK